MAHMSVAVTVASFFMWMEEDVMVRKLAFILIPTLMITIKPPIGEPPRKEHSV